MSFDFDAAVTAPFRMQPGLRRLPQGQQTLHGLAPASAAFAEKLAVLQQAPQTALLCTSDFDPSPGWHVLAGEAHVQCPDAILTDAERLTAPALGLSVRWDGTDPEPLATPHEAALSCLHALPPSQRLAGLLSLALHEDFAIVDGITTRLQALAVCLPSRWTPSTKIGHSFTEVHAAVADNDTLLAAARHLLALVCQDARWERFVWTISNQKRHDQHPHRHAPIDWPSDPQAQIATAHWRTEHQGFLPLPGKTQALFTIHVEVQPLEEAISTPARAATLHAALASMSDAVLAYRGLTTARPALLAWLSERAALA